MLSHITGMIIIITESITCTVNSPGGVPVRLIIFIAHSMIFIPMELGPCYSKALLSWAKTIY